MTSLRVICGLGPPPIKNPGYAYGHTSIHNRKYFLFQNMFRLKGIIGSYLNPKGHYKFLFLNRTLF